MLSRITDLTIAGLLASASPASAQGRRCPPSLARSIRWKMGAAGVRTFETSARTSATAGRIDLIGPKTAGTGAIAVDEPTDVKISSIGGRIARIGGKTSATGGKPCGIAGKTAATGGPAALTGRGGRGIRPIALPAGRPAGSAGAVASADSGGIPDGPTSPNGSARLLWPERDGSAPFEAWRGSCRFRHPVARVSRKPTLRLTFLMILKPLTL